MMKHTYPCGVATMHVTLSFIAAAAALQEPTCVIVKHTNPCGVATREDLLEAYRLAVIADPVSAFGGIVAVNRTVDEKLARELREFRCVCML
jgi:phosphoribosylaminoimidazolecarboxamide formyltransferase/IMP cyclohydrolase